MIEMTLYGSLFRCYTVDTSRRTKTMLAVSMVTVPCPMQDDGRSVHSSLFGSNGCVRV